MLTASIVSALAAHSKYDCPKSSAFIHASAQVTAVAQASCGDVADEMRARINGQWGHWHDPHNNGTYTLLHATGNSSLKLQRATGNGKYHDKLNFVLEPTTASTCTVLACSESQVTSVADFGTNYCNMRMLYCSSGDGCKPVVHDIVSKETSVSTSSPAATHDLGACLKV